MSEPSAPVEKRSRLLRNYLITALIGMVLLGLIATLSRPVAFADNTVERVVRILATLMLVALIFERALEVFVTTWRDPGAALLSSALRSAEDALSLPALESGTPPRERHPSRGRLVEDRAEGVQRLSTYRATTRRYTLQLAFVAGLALAAAGLRTIEFLLADANAAPRLQLAALRVLDGLLTGGVIAGGSEGIHRIIKAFTDVAEAASQRAGSASR